jgi:acyl dehydratase
VYFEEFYQGQEFYLDPFVITLEEMQDFARRYDRQPIHIDSDYAAEGPFAGVIASGFHTLSAVWGRWIETGRFGRETLGGKGLERVEWRAPIRPGDTLKTTVRVVDTRASLSQPRGSVHLYFETQNQAGVVVMVTEGTVLIKRRS